MQILYYSSCFFLCPPFLYMFYMLELPTMNTYYLHRETKETIQS